MSWDQERMDALRDYDAAATPAPWQYLRGKSWGGQGAIGTAEGHPIAFVGDPDAEGVDEDSSLIVAARNALPDLLDELDRLHAENLRLRELLAEAADDVAQWGNYADLYFQEKWWCPGMPRVQGGT